MEMIIFYLLLLLAACFDLKEKRIPNLIVFPGIILGLLLSHTLEAFLLKLLAIGVIFFMGMFPIMGMGDIKLWMMITAFIGFKKSLFIFVAGSILLVLYGFLIHTKESKLILKHMYYSILGTKQIPTLIEQKSYAFAPFLFAGTILIELGAWFS